MSGLSSSSPAVTPRSRVEAQVALTLRAVAGLATDEIARAFLVPAETMKRRLTRAKTKIRDAGIPFTRPRPDGSPERLAVVLAVVYLIFNQGYSAPGQAGHLAAEAIRLGRVLAGLLPGQTEPRGLLALMLLHDARRHARLAGPDGQDLVLLADQDRVAVGLAADRGGARDPRPDHRQPRPVPDPGGDRLAAGGGSRSTGAQIAALYAELAELTGSPVVRLNGAVAVAQADGPGAALEIVDGLDLRRLPVLALDPGGAAAPSRTGRRGACRLPRPRSPWPGPSRSGASCAGGSRSSTDRLNPSAS